MRVGIVKRFDFGVKRKYKKLQYSGMFLFSFKVNIVTVQLIYGKLLALNFQFLTFIKKLALSFPEQFYQKV